MNPTTSPKTVLQIETLDANELLSRFDKLENALLSIVNNGINTAKTKEIEYLTRDEVAEMLKITLMTVNEWANKGILKRYKIGKRVLFKKNEVEEAIAEIKK